MISCPNWNFVEWHHIKRHCNYHWINQYQSTPSTWSVAPWIVPQEDRLRCQNTFIERWSIQDRSICTKQCKVFNIFDCHSKKQWQQWQRWTWQSALPDHCFRWGSMEGSRRSNFCISSFAHMHLQLLTDYEKGVWVKEVQHWYFLLDLWCVKFI